MTLVQIWPRRLAKRAVRAASSSMVKVIGRDLTEKFSSRPTMVLAPHPDDETLGCGATIARLSARGVPVHVAFITGGGKAPRPDGLSVQDLIELRRVESAQALSLLGVADSSITRLAFQDGSMQEQHAEIVRSLGRLIESVRPEQVLVTSSRDRHPDHVAGALAARSAVARAKQATLLYEYPIWQRVPAYGAARQTAEAVVRRRGGCSSHDAARPALVRSLGYLDRKRAAIAVYKSQLPHFPPGFVDDFLLPFESFAQVRLRDHRG